MEAKINRYGEYLKCSGDVFKSEICSKMKSKILLLLSSSILSRFKFIFTIWDCLLFKSGILQGSWNKFSISFIICCWLPLYLSWGKMLRTDLKSKHKQCKSNFWFVINFNIWMSECNRGKILKFQNTQGWIQKISKRGSGTWEE